MKTTTRNILKDGFFKSLFFVRLLQQILGLSRVSVKCDEVITRSVTQNLILFVWTTIASCYYCLLLYYKLQHTTNGLWNWLSVYLTILLTYSIQVVHVLTTTKVSLILYKSCQQIKNIYHPQFLSVCIFFDYISYVSIVVVFFYVYQIALILWRLYKNHSDLFIKKYYLSILPEFAIDIDILVWAKICHYLKINLQIMNTYLLQNLKCTRKAVVIVNQRIKIRQKKIFQKQDFVFVIERTIFCFNLAVKIYQFTVSNILL